MVSIDPVVAKIDIAEIENSEESFVSYLSNIIFDGLFKGNIQDYTNDYRLRGYINTNTVPLSTYYPIDSQETLYNSGIDLETIESQILNGSFSEDTFMWGQIELSIKMESASVCEIKLTPK